MITRSRNNSILRAEPSWFLTAIEIPANFEPRVIQSGRIYGFGELPAGEAAIGVLGIAL